MSSQQAMDIRDQRESIGELILQLAGQSASLVHDEVALAKREIREKASRVSVEIAVIASGLVIGLLAAMSLCAGAIIALGRVVGLVEAAFIVGGGLLLVALAVTMIGVHRLRKTNLTPKDTIDSIQESKEWLTKNL